MIERASGISVWRQIEQALAEEIRSGSFREGDRLPTEADLSARFEVNRHTVRRAIGALADQGLVRVEQGRGTFVRENLLEYLVGRRTRFSENVLRANRAPGGREIELERERASAEAARDLGIRAGVSVIRLETVGEVDGRPVSVATHRFPAKLFPEFESVYRATGSITRVMEAHGFPDYERAVTKVTARMPDSADADRLEQPRTRPILYVEAINVSADGLRLQSSHARYCADRLQLVFETRPLDTQESGGK